MLITNIETIVLMRLAGVALATTLSLPLGVAAENLIPPPQEAVSAQDAQITQLRSTAKISNIQIKTSPPRYDKDTLHITVDVTNVTDKTISGMRVIAQSLDVFGRRLDGFYAFSTDHDIQPNQTVTLESFRSGREFLRANREKVTHTAEPIHVIFSDGQELKNPRFQ